MQQVSFDVSSRLQHHPTARTEPIKTPADQDFLRLDVALDLGILAENKRQAMDIAVHPPIDSEFALRCHIAGDRQIFADGRGLRWARNRFSVWVLRHLTALGQFRVGRDLMAESWPSLGGLFCAGLNSVFGPFLARVHF